MKITLNNRIEEIDTVANAISIDELIKIKNFTFKMLVTKLNGKLVKREERPTTMVHSGDEVLIIHLISGG